MRCAGLFTTNRRPELRVVKLSKLSHSELREVPDDFICDDRLSLVGARACVKDMRCVMYFFVSTLDVNT